MVRSAQGKDGTPKGLEDALYDWFTESQVSADLRKGVPCPQPAIRLILADRWHMPPWAFDDVPADEFVYWLNVLGVEAESHADREGMDPSEESVRFG